MPDDLDNLEDDHPEGPKALREALKREQDRAAAAQAELDALKRDAAFRDAGMDLSNPQHAAMARGYDGDPTGISEWVNDLGLTAPSAPPPVPDQERETLERIASASAGDHPGAAPEPQADKDREMRELTARATKEGWTTNRYHDEMRAVSQKYGMPIQSMEIDQNFGVSR